MTSLSDLGYNPLWMSYTVDMMKGALVRIEAPVLWSSYAQYNKVRSSGRSKNIMFYIDELSMRFFEEARTLRSLSTDFVLVACVDQNVGGSNELKALDRYQLLGLYFKARFGIEVFRSICTPGAFIYSALPVRSRARLVDLFDATEDEVMQIFSKASAVFLRRVISCAHPSRNFDKKKGISSSEIVGKYFCLRRLEVACGSDRENKVYLSCLDPMRGWSDLTGSPLAKLLLSIEFGEVLSLECISNFRRDRIDISQVVEGPGSIPSWPKRVSQDTINRCILDYYNNTKWVKPYPCAVCGRMKHGVKVEAFDAKTFASISGNILDVEKSKLPSSLHSLFDFSDPNLKGKILDGRAILFHAGVHVLSACEECMTSLQNGLLPKFSLANGLFRGEVPAEFKDLTWVEELVCCLYKPTGFVTRLYGSRDPQYARLMKGNTCAHLMNVSSTIGVLPRTTADVRGMLSVVFIGTASFDKAYLREVFHVRREKVWRFLLWLKRYNVLYRDIRLDYSIMSQYPESDMLPGIENRVLHVDLPSEDIFEEETAGISEHPAQNVNRNDCPIGKVYLERFGVADPEGSTVLGRNLHAAAVRNATKSMKVQPDLYLSNSVKPIAEYDNPSLIPGMFPTLYPLGIGGLDDKTRSVPISLRAHVDYLLDSNDGVFRKHHSFIFIVLNIYLRRMCHLHTHLVVSRRNMDEVSDKLKGVTSASLLRLSEHLQDESLPRNLNTEEKGAFDLLKLVNAVSANVPGSEASKLKMRNTVLAYSAYFGVPTIYLTVNPNAQHSPIFQLMYGDIAVNLDSRYPEIVNSSERAIRLAEDPVAGADFYQFCVTSVFRDLFGWDFVSRAAFKEGLLGQIKAFFGSDEFTDRGQLHGHFVIWLEGAMNPKVLHDHLRRSIPYRDQFFAFFDDVIKHDLPDVECDSLLDPEYDPRVQRPIPPPNFEHCDPEGKEKAMESWVRQFLIDVKGCGEKLQRHVCRPVCHKYGNEGKCRFLFPHDIVEESYFDEESNSILLRVRDPTVNYYNPYILVFCRHNHDIKCILSGKSAKAAMMYISDYITKMDLKTYHMLSVLSKAVVNMCRPGSSESDAEVEVDISTFLRNDAKQFLHTCLSQFARLREVHAQQAVRIFRGFEGSWESHKSKVMLSRALIGHVMRTYKLVRPSTSCDGDGDGDESESDKELERETIALEMDDDGRLIRTNQVHDYFYRHDDLKDVFFYEFVTRFKLRKIKDTKNGESSGRSYKLKESHQLHRTHELIEVKSRSVVVPRVYGCNIPRPSNEWEYKLFCLAHFRPFDVDRILVLNSSDVIPAFDREAFDVLAKRVIENWDALAESEDARDAERMKKGASLSKESRLMRELARKQCSIDDTLNCLDVGGSSSFSVSDYNSRVLVNTMAGCGWFEKADDEDRNMQFDKRMYERTFATVSPKQMRRWRQEMKHAEVHIRNKRRDVPVESQTIDLTVRESQLVAQPATDVVSNDRPDVVRGTKTGDSDECSIINAIEEIRTKNGLNDEQSLAYRIIVTKYLELLTARESGKEPESDALRLFLTGPGGTGKTHVVNCVKEVMALYGKSHTIRFLAPTGTAAALIDGTTVHSGLGISIKNDNSVSGAPSEASVQISIKNKTELRAEWKHVDVVFIDEVSMISLNLLGQIDHALRFVKEKTDKWFGNVIMIFSGDLYQYPPVRSFALYSSISPNANMTNKELHKRIGALAWNSVTDVVELTEQHRMKDDPEYAAAVLRLRNRTCTVADAILFNSRLVKSECNANGIRLEGEALRQSIAIVQTNNQRKALNLMKARSNCEGHPNRELVLCEALDVFADTHSVVPNDLPTCARDNLLKLDVKKKDNGSANLPGLIPMYVGMPVVLKEKNISTDLGITNGATGVIEHITFKSFSEVGDRYVVDVLFVRFNGCNVGLSALPTGVVPLTPITTSFKASLDLGGRSKEVHKLTRHQMCVQPGFAVTGHSAQGQTLPFVITDLAVGGFSAYVAASRAKSREGLAIVREVSVNDLNSKLPDELISETKRLQCIARNTKIKYGVCGGQLTDVECAAGLNLKDLKDPKDAYSAVIKSFSITYVDRSTSSKRTSPKDGASSNARKKQKKNHELFKNYDPASFASASMSPTSEQLPVLPLWTCFGCKWKNDLSCAYDAAVMSIFAAYYRMHDNSKHMMRGFNEIAHEMTTTFDSMSSDSSNSDLSSHMNGVRDRLRFMASQIRSDLFPREGPHLVPIGELLNLVLSGSGDYYQHGILSPLSRCDVCGPVDTFVYQDIYSVGSTRYEGTILDAPNERTSSICSSTRCLVTALWIRELQPFDERFYVAVSSHHSVNCRGHVSHSWTFLHTPPVLLVEVPHDYPSAVAISLKIQMSNDSSTFALSSIIMLQDAHYWSYLFIEDVTLKHDGQIHEGTPQTLGRTSSIFNMDHDAIIFGEGPRPCVALYSLI